MLYEVITTEIGADAYIAKGPFDVMGKHVLAAIEASEAPRTGDEPKPIKGLESIYRNNFV